MLKKVILLFCVTCAVCPVLLCMEHINYFIWQLCDPTNQNYIFTSQSEIRMSQGKYLTSSEEGSEDVFYEVDSWESDSSREDMVHREGRLDLVLSDVYDKDCAIKKIFIPNDTVPGLPEKLLEMLNLEEVWYKMVLSDGNSACHIVRLADGFEVTPVINPVKNNGKNRMRNNLSIYTAHTSIPENSIIAQVEEVVPPSHDVQGSGLSSVSIALMRRSISFINESEGSEVQNSRRIHRKNISAFFKNTSVAFAILLILCNTERIKNSVYRLARGVYDVGTKAKTTKFSFSKLFRRRNSCS